MQRDNVHYWNKEYKRPKLITRAPKPQKDFLRFLQWVKRNKHLDLRGGIRVLDIGCGIGRNAYYMADTYSAEVVGWDYAKDAIALAENQFQHPLVHFEERDIRQTFPLKDESIDLILDITSSNSLKEKEREKYIEELIRVLRPGGYLYLRTLAREGDKNAQNMLKKFPGSEKGMYVHPELQIEERVFTGPEIKETYGKNPLRVVRMLRKTGYQKFGKQHYKRNYWNVYLTKERS